MLKQMLLSHLSSAPALIPLEDDLRCGPLLPGASMSARLRFLALREGVHTLSQLRVTGANEEFDFVLRCVSPVLWLVLPGDAHGPARYWTLWLGLASITTDQLDGDFWAWGMSIHACSFLSGQSITL